MILFRGFKAGEWAPVNMLSNFKHVHYNEAVFQLINFSIQSNGSIIKRSGSTAVDFLPDVDDDDNQYHYYGMFVFRHLFNNDALLIFTNIGIFYYQFKDVPQHLSDILLKDDTRIERLYIKKNQIDVQLDLGRNLEAEEILNLSYATLNDSFYFLMPVKKNDDNNIIGRSGFIRLYFKPEDGLLYAEPKSFKIGPKVRAYKEPTPYSYRINVIKQNNNFLYSIEALKENGTVITGFFNNIGSVYCSFAYSKTDRGAVTAIGKYWIEGYLSIVENGNKAEVKQLTPDYIGPDNPSNQNNFSFTTSQVLFSAFTQALNTPAGVTTGGIGILGVSVPSCFTFFQGRLWMGEKAFIFASAISENMFDFTYGSDADMAFTKRIADEHAGEIRWMKGAGEILLLGCSGGIFAAIPAANQSSLTNSSFVIRRVSDIYAGSIIPQSIKNGVVYTDGKNRDLYISIFIQGNVFTECLSKDAPHLFNKSIRSLSRNVYNEIITVYFVDGSSVEVNLTNFKPGDQYSICAVQQNKLGGISPFTVQGRTVSFSGYDYQAMLTSRPKIPSGNNKFCLEIITPTLDLSINNVFEHRYLDCNKSYIQRAKVLNISNRGYSKISILNNDRKENLLQLIDLIYDIQHNPTLNIQISISVMSENETTYFILKPIFDIFVDKLFTGKDAIIFYIKDNVIMYPDFDAPCWSGYDKFLLMTRFKECNIEFHKLDDGDIDPNTTYISIIDEYGVETFIDTTYTIDDLNTLFLVIKPDISRINKDNENYFGSPVFSTSELITLNSLAIIYHLYNESNGVNNQISFNELVPSIGEQNTDFLDDVFRTNFIQTNSNYSFHNVYKMYILPNEAGIEEERLVFVGTYMKIIDELADGKVIPDIHTWNNFTLPSGKGQNISLYCANYFLSEDDIKFQTINNSIEIEDDKDFLKDGIDKNLEFQLIVQNINLPGIRPYVSDIANPSLVKHFTNPKIDGLKKNMKLLSNIKFGKDDFIIIRNIDNDLIDFSYRLFYSLEHIPIYYQYREESPFVLIYFNYIPYAFFEPYINEDIVLYTNIGHGISIPRIDNDNPPPDGSGFVDISPRPDYYHNWAYEVGSFPGESSSMPFANIGYSYVSNVTFGLPYFQTQEGDSIGMNLMVKYITVFLNLSDGGEYQVRDTFTNPDEYKEIEYRKNISIAYDLDYNIFTYSGPYKTSLEIPDSLETLSVDIKHRQFSPFQITGIAYHIQQIHEEAS